MPKSISANKQRSKGKSSISISPLEHCSHHEVLLKVNGRSHDACIHPEQLIEPISAACSCFMSAYADHKVNMWWITGSLFAATAQLGWLLRSSAGYCWCWKAKKNTKPIIQMNQVHSADIFIFAIYQKDQRSSGNWYSSGNGKHMMRIWAVIQVRGYLRHYYVLNTHSVK